MLSKIGQTVLYLTKQCISFSNQSQKVYKIVLVNRKAEKSQALFSKFV